jgi:hypothetical protein
MKKVANLASLYKDKADFIAASGCSTNLNTDLELLISMTKNLDSSSDLYGISEKADEINMINKNNALCKLW